VVAGQCSTNPLNNGSGMEHGLFTLQSAEMFPRRAFRIAKRGLQTNEGAYTNTDPGTSEPSGGSTPVEPVSLTITSSRLERPATPLFTSR